MIVDMHALISHMAKLIAPEFLRSQIVEYDFF